MKEFNLEEAKNGKAVCTRDGRSARIICFDRKSNSYPIIALIAETIGNGEDYKSYTIDGKFDGRGKTDNLDLMMVGEKKEGWINIYHNHSCGGIFDTEEEAKKYMYGRGTTIKIEWEE